MPNIRVKCLQGDTLFPFSRNVSWWRTVDSLVLTYGETYLDAFREKYGTTDAHWCLLITKTQSEAERKSRGVLLDNMALGIVGYNSKKTSWSCDLFVYDEVLRKTKQEWIAGRVARKQIDGTKLGKASWQEFHNKHNCAFPSTVMAEGRRHGIFPREDNGKPLFYYVAHIAWEKFVCLSTQHSVTRSRVFAVRRAVGPISHAMYLEELWPQMLADLNARHLPLEVFNTLPTLQNWQDRLRHGKIKVKQEVRDEHFTYEEQCRQAA